MGEFGRFKFGVLAAAALGAFALTNGCSAASSLQSSLCCSDFKPGSDMSQGKFVSDASVNVQFRVFAQAVGDISAVSGAALSDVTAACQSIATDLGDDPSKGMGMTGQGLMNFWCGEAVTQIKANLTAAGTLTINAQPPQCSASLQATASCQASCNVNGTCDIKANPPTCMGGTLEVSCNGTCMAMGMASFDCTGSCSGACSGSCQASVMNPVMCQGQCDGACSATDAMGNCNGMCNGKCTFKAGASATCMGTCSGGCMGSCSPPMAGGSVQCSGMCMATPTPLSCKGGTLSGGCMVDANCQANCNASVQAKAECTPPSITITASGTASAQVDALIATLEKNLPALLVVIKARGQAFLTQMSGVVQGGATIAGSGKIDLSGASCLTLVASSIGQSVSDFTATLSAGATVTTSVGM
jgi:hypothetical protein